MSSRSIVAVVLGLLTGLVLGQLLTPSLIVQPNSSAQERTTESAAASFYEAINQYLELGNPDILSDVLDSDFVDRSAIGPEQDAAGLLRYLRAMRATYPDMRVEVESVTPRDDLAAVSLATTAGTAANPGGVVSDRPPSAPGYERLRIVDGKVAERWASQILPPQYELFALLDLRFFAGWFVECVAEPLQLAPGASESRRLFSSSLLIAGSGSVALEIERNKSNDSALLLSGDLASPTALRRGARINLENQSVVMLPEGEAYRVWNTGQRDANVIIVEIHYQSPTVTFNDGQNFWIDPTSEGGQDLPNGLLPMGTDPDRTFTLSLARVAAAPNESLSIHPVSGLEQLLVVGGNLDVELHAGDAAVFGADGQEMLAPGDRRQLSPGEGLAANSQSLLSYRVSREEPATIWFITLAPLTKS